MLINAINHYQTGCYTQSLWEKMAWYGPTHSLSVEFDLAASTMQRMVAVMTPLYGHQGHVIVLQDVTARRRLDRMRRDFLTNVSHKAYGRVLVDAIERNSAPGPRQGESFPLDPLVLSKND